MRKVHFSKSPGKRTYCVKSRLNLEILEDRLCLDSTTSTPEVTTPPTAIDDQYAIVYDGMISAASPGVLANDVASDLEALTAELMYSPLHGTVQLNSDGDFQYTPNAGYIGSDNFTYRVWDGNDWSNIATVNLSIPLTGASPGFFTRYEGSSDVDFLGTVTVSDPNLLESDLSGIIDWADGNQSFPTIVPMGNGVFNLYGSHAYADNGLFTQRINISSTNGNNILLENNIQVINVAPENVLVHGPTNAMEGESLNYLATFSDPGILDTHTLEWVVEDENGQTMLSGTDSNLTFIPPDDGIFQVIVTVRDSDNASSTFSHSLTVSNVAPTLSIGTDQTILEGDEYFLFLNSSDPGDDSIQSWTINWGDGSTLETVQGSPASVSHRFLTPGAFVVTAQATDEDGTYSSSNTATVIVENVAPQLTYSITYNTQNYFTVSGQVIDAFPGGIRVDFTGVIDTFVITNLNGYFEFITSVNTVGNIHAQATDNFGMTSSVETRALQSEKPVFLEFGAARNQQTNWTVTGRIQDEYVQGLTILIYGMGLENINTTADDEGRFTVDVTFAAPDWGTISATVTDWYSLESDPANFNIYH